MRTLIVELPLGPAGAGASYRLGWITPEAAGLSLQQSTVAAGELPAANRDTEVVVMLPAAAMSWHRVELPAGVQRQLSRLQSVLEGLLEDSLLDEPQTVHLALQPGWESVDRPWAVACRRDWIVGHLQALDASSLAVHRIVPEFFPTFPAQATALGDVETGCLWLCDATHGVWAWPLVQLHSSDDLLRLLPGDTPQPLQVVQAEPGAAGLFQERLQCSTILIASGHHWQHAVHCDWDIAQFGLRNYTRGHAFKLWQRLATTTLHGPAWRPARWGMGALLVALLLGLNAWAWKTRANWQMQQEHWAQILRESFPEIQTVVDAPLQMEREVARLRQNAGLLAAQDLQTMLAALGTCLPASAAAPDAYDFADGQLRIQGLTLSRDEQDFLKRSLATKGYDWQAAGNAWLMRASTGGGA